MLWLAAPPAAAGTLEGRVIHVADGDTLTVLDSNRLTHKVRIAGIDAPERGQPFGRRAQETLAALAWNRQVLVSGKKIDRYWRRVGIVRVAPPGCDDCPPAIDIGLSMLDAGLAWHYRAYEREQPAAERENYRRAESAARTAQLGLWADAAAMPPWDWRQVRRAGGAARQ
ncbi:MAG: thermonuclease family protein [Burkholderiales bacterium]|nr:thermonuclease family protein [Burkholderiales bacterium]